MHRFELVTRDGKPLGTEVARLDWPPGSTIHRGNGDNLRVIDVTVGDDGETTILVVEES